MSVASAAAANAVPPPSGRKVPCEKCPLRDIHALREFSAKELEFVSEFKSGELNVAAGTNILLQGTNSAHLYTILSGWSFRYKMLPDGRRQILNYALPSDFLGLQGSVNDEMQHSVEALTDMTLCVFPRDKLWQLYRDYPTLAFDVTWLAAREEQILEMVAEGRSNEEIADALVLSVRTVERHLSNSYAKLRVSGKAARAAAAARYVRATRHRVG